MKKIACIIVGILFLSCFGASGITNSVDIKTKVNAEQNIEYSNHIDDLSTQIYFDLYYPDTVENEQKIIDNQLINSERDWDIGKTIWQYYITGDIDPGPEAIISIPDINDDNIDDVIVCSDDDYVRCFDGSAVGTGVVLWEHEIYSGSLWCQNQLTITEDVDDDGYNDVVVGTAWGDRSVHTLSGKNGNEIWKYDTHQEGDGGWVYQVDCSYDYNDDDVIDVLAAAGGTSSGARRAYCLDGIDGDKIWDRPLGSPSGPGFSIIGIEDFTGDGQPDVLAGASNSGETQGYAYGINGETGGIVWSFTTGGSSVWALAQIDDITDDGIKDVIIGDSFTGNIYGLDATSGSMEYSNSLGSAGITIFAKLNDVNGDDHPDFVPGHSTLHVIQAIDGQTGAFIWTHSVIDQPWVVARTADISGDTLDDVLVGTLFNSNYCYYLNGVDGSELHKLNHAQPVDAIAAIPDVTDDDSMEMVAGGRQGKVTCYSGGLDALFNDPPFAPTISGPTDGAINVNYDFNFVAIDPDGDNVSYYIDWDDGSIEDWFGPYLSSEVVTVGHTWTSAGDFNIKSKAKDVYDYESEWSEIHPITIIENSAPSIPDINGSKKGDVGKFYTYTFTSALDPEGDDVSYYIEWGDGSTSGWTTFIPSGPPGYSESHKWTSEDTYTIKAKAKDIYGAESGWGEFEIEITKYRFAGYRFLAFFRDFFCRLQILNKLIFN